MSVLGFRGFETGDGLELPSGLATGFTVSNVAPRTGVYALLDEANVDNPVFSGLTIESGFSTSEIWVRIAVRPAVVGSSLGNNVASANVVIGSAAGNTFQFGVTTFGGSLNISQVNYVTAAGVFTDCGIGGGSVPLTASTYAVIEMYAKTGAGTGAVGLRVDGVSVLSLTGIDVRTNAMTNVQIQSTRESSTKWIRAYWDDYARGDAWVGLGGSIARQGLAGTPTYNAWTKSSGTAASALWSDTPFNATSECHSTAQNQAQTMLVADAGAGTNAIGGSDTINACRVIGVGKLRAGTNKRTYSVRRRIGGADTDESVTAQQSTAGDAIFNGSIFTTTLANLQSAEIGGLRGATTANSQEWQIEDMWMMVDYTPAAGRTTRNTRSHPLGVRSGMGFRIAP